MRATRSVSLLLLALAASACGGSSTGTAPTPPVAPAATSLRYVDPPGAGWRLVADPSSTSTRIVLNLVGPSGQLTRGVGFNLKAPAGVRFEALEGGLPVRDLGVYDVRAASNPSVDEPVAVAGGVKAGNVLTVGVYQKDRGHPAKDSGTPLLQIALALDAGAPPAAGASLPLSVPKAKVIPEDIGLVTDETFRLDKKMRMADVAVAVGSLTAN